MGTFAGRRARLEFIVRVVIWGGGGGGGGGGGVEEQAPLGKMIVTKGEREREEWGRW